MNTEINYRNGMERLPLHPNLVIEGHDKFGKYQLYAREVNPPGSTTMIVFTHGAAPNNRENPDKNSNPLQLYEYFQDRFAKEGFSSLVFNTRGVGKNVKVAENLQIPMQSDRDYFAQSLNDRIDDLTEVLLNIESRANPPQKYILAGISMGADTTTRILQKLLEMAGPDSTHEETPEEIKNRKCALSIMQKISGLMLFSPAAYRKEIYDMPSGSQEKTQFLQRRLGHENEFTLDDPKEGSDTLIQILPHTRYSYPNSVPLFVGGREDDKVVWETLPLYKKEIYNPQDFVMIPGDAHEGLLKEIKDPEDPREKIYESAISFAKRASNKN
ncbi:MAG TPA: alpha/beta hydrolase [Patescibacteria group bacterium]